MDSGGDANERVKAMREKRERRERMFGEAIVRMGRRRMMNGVI